MSTYHYDDLITLIPVRMARGNSMIKAFFAKLGCNSNGIVIFLLNILIKMDYCYLRISFLFNRILSKPTILSSIKTRHNKMKQKTTT